MKYLSEVVKKRSIPGVIIFDAECRMLFCNKEAVDMVPELGQKLPESPFERGAILQSIYSLCSRVSGNFGKREDAAYCTVVGDAAGCPVALRAFVAAVNKADGSVLHVMILMERVARKRCVNFKEIGRTFNCSSREIEVLGLLCQGLSNKEISSTLFISEYTVKDHLKSIMLKMGASSRNQITSLIR